jgi:hypothetical protein
MAKQIPLTQEKVALVDDADFELLAQFKWHAWQPPKSHTFYAARGLTLPNGKRGISYMHREILAVAAGIEVDHKDGNGINNQRSNLRPSTRRQNSYNQVGWRQSTSKFKGVSTARNSTKWRARIMIDGKEQYLGSFDNEIDAARAYDIAAREHFGEYAHLNFPQEHLEETLEYESWLEDEEWIRRGC